MSFLSTDFPRDRVISPPLLNSILKNNASTKHVRWKKHLPLAIEDREIRTRKIAGSWSDWFLGSLQGRDNFSAWMVMLADAFRNSDFLLKFETIRDPWERSRYVGTRISDLRKTFAKLTPQDKAELAKRGETELRAGMELLSRDKKQLLDLLQAIDPPAIAQ